MKSVLYALQASHTHMSARGGSIVVIGPSLSLAGAPQLVPLSTAIEGQRGLVKSSGAPVGQARPHGQLDRRGAARAVAAVRPRCRCRSSPIRCRSHSAGRSTSRREIVPVIEFLGSAGRTRDDGATLMLDGGEWMVP